MSDKKDLNTKDKSMMPSTDKSPSQEPSSKMTAVEALLAAQKLLGCFRQGEANDPVVYGSAIAAVFTNYSRTVVLYVCHPFTGLPSKSVWMPAVYEVKVACDERATYEAKVEIYRNWGKASIEAHSLAISGPQEARPTLEELWAKYGKNWGLHDEMPELTSVSRSAISADALIDHYAFYRLGFGKRVESTRASVVEPVRDGVTKSTLTKMRTFKRLARWVVGRIYRI